MKEITGKQKSNQIFSPKKLKLTKPLYKIHKTLLKNSPNFLLLLDQIWWKRIPNTEKNFQDFLTSNMQFEKLNFDEFEKAFKSLKRNKAAVFGDFYN